MEHQAVANRFLDPQVPHWEALQLPDAWPDHLDFRRPQDLWVFIKSMIGWSRVKVSLPEQLPGAERIPKYILQEFHNLPNGNYSKRITRGYITGFERVMMGTMAKARRPMAEKLAGVQSVLDVGCAGGRMAAAVSEQGASDVWGIDPSPYLLQHAAKAYPKVNFVQGLAEDTGFADARFDAVTACFLFHEMPPRYIDLALAEFNRILKPGGLVALTEPSPLQLSRPRWQLYQDWGWRGVYFAFLARFVFEPFVIAWHKQDMQQKFAEFGFELLEDVDTMPVRQFVARKIAQ
jgi:ubiquinone/menaquinone biosynthesis C-methylase UbiE